MPLAFSSAQMAHANKMPSADVDRKITKQTLAELSPGSGTIWGGKEERRMTEEEEHMLSAIFCVTPRGQEAFLLHIISFHLLSAHC